MSAAQLLTELESLGVKVWPDAGVLRFKATAGAMTPELAARVKAVKPELLAILTTAPAATCRQHRTCHYRQLYIAP